MQLLDGKTLSQKLKKEIAAETSAMLVKTNRIPHLAAIMVGQNGASESYVANKIKSCREVGFNSTLVRFNEDVSEDELLRKVEELNSDHSIDGIIVQLPLPKHIDQEKVAERIDYKKDVDGFHPINMGKMQRNHTALLPATPYGILLLLEANKIETHGKHCVVVGNSNIVGSPISRLMARDNYPGNCTVTTCHIYTQDLKSFTLKADILIVAIGKKHFITADMVKEGVVIIDVGITREPSDLTKSGYKLYGDVDFDTVASKAKWITPVPGGVGPMTIIGLLRNTITAANNKTL